MQANQSDYPTGIHEDALVGYLHTATLCTVDLETYRQFYGEAMKMKMEGPIDLSEEEKTAQKLLWNIPDGIDYDLYHFHRSAVPSLIHMRVLHLKTPTPHIHQSYNSYELGSFSLGFPTADAKGMDARMKEYGVGAMAPMQLGDIVRKDGTGHYLETIYQGPDFLHCVGIERVNYPQLAPCDPKDGFGGPGYSALVVKDSDAEISFFVNVLEYYTLFDAVWETAEGSALGIDAGVPFRFVSMYSPGAKQNHILLLDFKDGGAIDTGVPTHLPNQGLGMYTFQTKDLAKVLEKTKSNGIKIMSAPRKVKDHILGNGEAMVLQSPGGIYVEIFQPS